MTGEKTLKRIIQRTCLGCRQVKAKREMVRLVRSSQGIVADSTGKKPGRGAYVCPYRECWEKALKGNRLEHALRTPVTPEEKANLLSYGRSMSSRSETGDLV